MDETCFRQYLADLGDVNADRSRQLPAPLRDLHRQILEHFAATGGSPAPETFRDWATTAGAAPQEALEGLVKADLAEAELESGRILGAYPFTTAPRGHRVDMDAGPTVQAYCAIDALSIPALLGRDAAITSRDPHSGAQIRIQVRAGQATWTPAGAVASMPAGDAVTSMDQPAADAACPMVNFYASAADADAYQRAHSLTLEILTIPQALRFAAAAFGPLLNASR